MWTILELAASLTMIIVVIGITIWQCAQNKFLWTFVPRNWVILYDLGDGTPYKVLGVTLGYTARWFNIHWIGPPAVVVHTFKLLHTRMNREIKEGEPSETWINKDSEPKTEDHLLRTVVHEVRVPGVEFNGNQRGDLLLQYTAEIQSDDDAKTAVYDREGKFYDDLEGVINASVISQPQIVGITYDDFVIAEKDANSPMCHALLETINQTASKISGYTLTSISVMRVGASSTEEQKASQAVRFAEIQAQAAISAAKGKVADIIEGARAIKQELKDADDNKVLDTVRSMVIADKIANSAHSGDAVLTAALLGVNLNSPANENPSGNKKKRGAKP